MAQGLQSQGGTVIQRATIHLELVTPAFVGGADQTSAAEWRAQSIRGQLRWWFRAVAGAAFDGDLAKTKVAEAAVFGSTGRRSRIQIRATDRPTLWTQADGPALGRKLTAEQLTTAAGYGPHHPGFRDTADRLKLGPQGKEFASNPVQYLGYGCVGLKGLERSCLRPEQPVSFQIGWHDRELHGLPVELRPLFLQALWAWLALGGIGSKARNGFGSLQWTETGGTLPDADGESLVLPATREAFQEGAARLLATATGEREPRQLDWTQLSRASKVYLARESISSWEEALVRVGAWIIAFRRRYGHPDDQRTLRNDRATAGRDYAWAAPRGRHRRGGSPDRAGFGLPLPFGEDGETVIWSPEDGNGGAGSGDRRRAAPLLVHIAHLEDGYAPVLTHLPSRFLPEGARVRFKGGTAASESEPTEAQTGIVDDFLEDLAGRALIRRITP